MKFSLSIFLLIFIFSCSISYAQEGKRKVLLRIGKHKDFNRIVLSYNEKIFNELFKVSVVNNNRIKISYPDDFNIEFQDKLIKEGELTDDFFLKKLDNYYIIETPPFRDFKIYKLSTPDRIVVDLYPTEKTHIEKPGTKTFIIIDPGHGGMDSGIRGRNSSEKDLTLSIAKQLSARLNQKSISSVITRQSDTEVSIRDRLKLWETNKADIFLSIHVSNDEVFRIYPQQQISVQDSRYRLLDDFIKKLKNRIEKNFSEPISIERVPVYGIKKQHVPFVLIEIPKKSLFSDVQYLEKITENLFECIKDTATSKKKVE